MQINREGIDRLLSMNDAQLKMIIRHLASQSGIDPAQFNMDTGSIESIRKALSSATDDDLKRVAEQYEKSKKR